jgi:ABC-type uncharacterized transport system auxiliary subunit
MHEESTVKRFAILAPIIAASFLLTACAAGDDSSPSTCYEIDVHHPSTKKTNTSKPKAPAYKAPSKKRRR